MRRDLEFSRYLANVRRATGTPGKQRLHDFLVGKRFVRLVAHQFNDGLFDGVLGDDLTGAVRMPA